MGATIGFILEIRHEKRSVPSPGKMDPFFGIGTLELKLLPEVFLVGQKRILTVDTPDDVSDQCILDRCFSEFLDNLTSPV